jgi:cytochrome c
MRSALLIGILCGTVACRGPAQSRRPASSADAERGRALIQTHGCATCHTIPGVPRARALVGPPLWGIADRAYIAGVLPNTEVDMIRWLQNPPAADPGTLMPNMGVSEQDARDITAYLYTLRAEPVAVRMVRGFIERAIGRQMPDPRGALSGRPD